MWDKWNPKECLRQTREQCCIINNFNADRINYAEVLPSPRQIESLGTPPDTPLSAQSLLVSLVVVKLEQTRRRPYELMEDLEMVDLQTKPKTKERKRKC
jgi:hypothetical protein